MTRKTECAELARVAELELTAFFNAVVESFGFEEAELSADEWVKEFEALPSRPEVARRSCRLVTAAAVARLAKRVIPETCGVGERTNRV